MFHWLIAIAVMIGVGVWKWQTISALFIQGGQVAIVVNSLIVGVFAIGLLSLAVISVRYISEEAAINDYVMAREDNPGDIPTLPAGTLIGERMRAVDQMRQKNVTPDHGYLASATMSMENARLGVARFANNSLILIGVFGTIVALSLALFSVADVISSADELLGIGSVIANMSTALSTTLTAITAFIIFNYLLGRVSDTQSLMLTRLEEVTALDLMPIFTLKNESVQAHVADTIGQAYNLLSEMRAESALISERSAHLNDLLHRMTDSHADDSQRLEEIARLLSQGFRINRRTSSSISNE
jgi:hypothetical protein